MIQELAIPSSPPNGAGGNFESMGASNGNDRPFVEFAMPYRTVNDLPKAQTDQYNANQKEAFLTAFNNAYEESKNDESRAFAVAHSAAKKAGERPGPG
jgi:cation transport regulator